jgi:hypothetical protein
MNGPPDFGFGCRIGVAPFVDRVRGGRSATIEERIQP